MAITYTDQYETKKAYVEMSLSDGNYIIDYIIKSPVGGSPESVDATVSLMAGENKSRVGYGSYSGGSVSIRFENKTSVANQATLSTQFFNDLQSILV